MEIPFQDTKININISGGVANSKSAKSWEDMVNLADERLYKSKEMAEIKSHSIEKER